MKKISLVLLVLIVSQWLCAQTAALSNHAKDWFKLDPLTDSIAGISYYKALALLQNKIMQPVVVAVIDNGVDIEHLALKDRIWTNTREIPGNGIDDDHNGYIDDIHGWNFRGAKDGTVTENEQAGATQVYLAGKSKNSEEIYRRAEAIYRDKREHSQDTADNKYAYNKDYHSSRLIEADSEQSDNHGYGSPLMKLSVNLTHGTHVAGIITSIDSTAIIMPLLAGTAIGDERDKDVANAIRYAADNGAQIINMSFSKIFSSDKPAVDAAILYAAQKNVLIVHSAGNDGVDIDSPTNYHYPIAILNNGARATNFISVGWNRPLFDYRLAHPYGDYGKMNVDLYAPGSDIWSAVPGNAFDFKSGSSMSAPVVSGVAAFLKGYLPSLTAVEFKTILLSTVFVPRQVVNKPQTTVPVAFNTLSVSGGIVNLFNALKSLQQQ